MNARHRRLSLWKRAVLYGLKTLVRRHPGAALHAAGATVAYAGREVAQEGADFVKEKVDDLGDAVGELRNARRRAARSRTTHEAGKRELSQQESRALLEKLSAEERRALARLGPHKPV